MSDPSETSMGTDNLNTKQQNKEDEKNDDDNRDSRKGQRSKRRKMFDSLHQEMELAQHGLSTRNGQFRRKVPRKQAVIRTRKRQLLESQDAIETAEVDVTDTAKARLRGSKVAVEDRVIQGSLIFGQENQRQQKEEETSSRNQLTTLSSNDNPEDDNEYEESHSVYDGVEEEEICIYSDDEEGDDDDDDDDDDIATEVDDEVDDDIAIEVDQDVDEEASDQEVEIEKDDANGDDNNTNREKSRTHGKQEPVLVPAGRRMYRLRNFKSTRLALKHGAALGAHAQGRPKEAIQRLKQVAKSAPSAPQIYSSLGMVYEDMLLESQKKRVSIDKTVDVSTSDPMPTTRQYSLKQSDANIPDKDLEEQLHLSKKAYGSYHIAAILCKRDYTFWVRAADCACDIANIHVSIMELHSIPDSIREFHRDERRRWLEEARNDYQIADNLKPPGIDIPSKLASVMIELGLLSEALTLLSDLKNSPQFGSSHKAWLLYADLMLRLGHECTQWNRGIQNTNNCMFRRWLRRLSKSFDWKERRLQALSKALEAACGSINCARLIQWMKARVIASREASGNDTRWHNDANNVDDIHQQEDCDADQQSTNDEQLKIEQQILVKRNAAELESFDGTTRELALAPNSIPANDRNSTRLHIIERHKASMHQLLGEFKQKDENEENHQPKSTDENSIECMAAKASENWEENLPLSASCETVSAIASELLRHMLDMQLFGGGQLVCEAVSHYFKERYIRRQKRKDKQKKSDDMFLESQNMFALQFNNYGDTDTRDDDDESDNPLSDDEEHDQMDDPVRLQSLKRGTLPTDLMIQYGLCLAAEGGKDFLAAKCIAHIDLLPQEPRSWLSEKIIDTGVTADNIWYMFQQSMTEQLGRTATYALAADVIRHSGRERNISKHIALLFRNHVKSLSTAGIIDDVFRIGRGKSSFALYRQNLIIKVLVAAARLEVEMSESMLSRGNFVNESIIAVNDVVNTLNRMLGFVWKVEPKASLSSTCIETIDAFSRALCLLRDHSDQILKSTEKGFMLDIVQNMLKPVSLLCGASILRLNIENDLSLDDLNTLPLQSSWLSPELKLLALRTFNLCVATNVSLFSGWEVDEFNIRLLRHGQVPNFFGITTDEGRVIGYLSPELEDSLNRQWTMLKKHLPPSFSFSFDSHLAAFQQTSEYRDAKERLVVAKQKHLISCYGEDIALQLLLSFSHACVVAADEADDNNLSTHLVLMALSIVIPVSEFCANVSIWDAEVGRNAVSSQFNINDWKNFDWDKDDLAPSYRPGYIRRRDRALFIPPEGSKAFDEWFGGENSFDPHSNLIYLPLSELQIEWKRSSVFQAEYQYSNGVEAMDKLSACVKQLRCCFSEVAVEKACLSIACALLQVAASRECQNRFLCIQQAVLFASQSLKSGTSDQAFQSPLPKAENCTPLEALLIIGRGDCLRAVCFYPEAAFLCSYVASVCRLHRDRTEIEFEWNGQWRIVSILAYDLSVMIRTAKNVTAEGTWEREVIDELLRARSDGVAWKSSLKVSDCTNGNSTTIVTEISTLSSSVVRELSCAGSDTKIHALDCYQQHTTGNATKRPKVPIAAQTIVTSAVILPNLNEEEATKEIAEIDRMTVQHQMIGDASEEDNAFELVEV